MCKFPAATLLKMMRKVALDADRMNDPGAVNAAAQYVKATNDLRFAHEEVTGCPCWHQAVKENPSCL